MARPLPSGPWRFYVYALTDDTGAIVYIGKGSGHRLTVQRHNHRCAGHELARFHREKHAYAFEREAIAEYRPERNKHPGGNGSTVEPLPQVRMTAQHRAEWREMECLGPRRYSAKFLLSLAPEALLLCNPPSEVDGIRRRLQEVLDGPRC